MFLLPNPSALERRNQLNRFRKNLRVALQQLADADESGVLRRLCLQVAEQVTRTPVVFRPLAATGLPPHLHNPEQKALAGQPGALLLLQRAPDRYVLEGPGITLPADHFFEGDRLTLDGLFHLCHAVLELPRDAFQDFADLCGLDHHTAQELLGDALLARVALLQGFARKELVDYFADHHRGYDNHLFRKYVLAAP